MDVTVKAFFFNYPITIHSCKKQYLYLNHSLIKLFFCYRSIIT